MRKHKLGLAALVLALGIAVVPGVQAAGISTGAGAFTPIDENVVAVKFCPIHILCKKGTHAVCKYNKHRHKCVCTCVRNGPIGIKVH
jgi:hypothetical protein